MSKTINLAKVSLSWKWFVFAILAFVLVIAVWTIANWLFGKARGATSGVTSRFTSI